MNPIDDESLAEMNIKLHFHFDPKKKMVIWQLRFHVEVNDSAKTKPYKYELKFTSATSFDVTNFTLDEVIRKAIPYQSGGRSLLITGMDYELS